MLVDFGHLKEHIRDAAHRVCAKHGTSLTTRLTTDMF